MSAKKMSYTEAYNELQEILDKLEQNELDVDSLSQQVKKASELIKFCKSRLHDTETEVEQIIKDMDAE